MFWETKEGKQAVNYFLGKLTEDEQSALEERFFTDAAYSDFLQAVEDDLIDEYVRGALSTAERERFEKRFLNTMRRRGKVEVAKAFLALESINKATVHSVAKREEKQSWLFGLLAAFFAPRPVLAYSMATIALLFLVGGLWGYFENRRLSYEIAQLRGERQKGNQQQEELRHRTERLQKQIGEQHERNDALNAELQKERERLEQVRVENENLERELEQLEKSRASQGESSIASAIATFILSPGISRSDDEPIRLVAPRGSRAARFQLDLERGDEYPLYRVELRTAGGNMIWSQDVKQARHTPVGPSVAVTLPLSLLQSGEYELTLRGVKAKGQFEDIGYYYFSILKR
jgi:hypothetical protein